MLNNVLNKLDLALLFKVGETDKVCKIRNLPAEEQADAIVKLLGWMESGGHMTEDGKPLEDPSINNWHPNESDALIRGHDDLVDKLQKFRIGEGVRLGLLARAEGTRVALDALENQLAASRVKK